MSDMIERELELPFSAGEAWTLLTDTDWLSQWLADEVSLELRPGGEAMFRIGTETRSGWIEEVSAPDRGRGRLAFWWAAGDAPASRVVLELTALSDERTLLRVAETRPLELLDLLGTPLPGIGGATYGPALAGVC